MNTTLSVTLSLALVAFAADAEAACPQDFAQFLAAFREDAAFRDAHTRFPTPYSFVDASAAPEPRVRRAVVTHRDHPLAGRLRLPLLEPGGSLTEKITVTHTGGRTVRIEKPDTDYQVDFHFIRGHSCWHLVRGGTSRYEL